MKDINEEQKQILTPIISKGLFLQLEPLKLMNIMKQMMENSDREMESVNPGEFIKMMQMQPPDSELSSLLFEQAAIEVIKFEYESLHERTSTKNSIGSD